MDRANLIVGITTLDNKWNPFTQWDEWYNYDMLHYNSWGLVAREAKVSDSMSDLEYSLEIERAIDLIVATNSNYVKVFKQINSNEN